MNNHYLYSRRNFVRQAGTLLTGSLLFQDDIIRRFQVGNVAAKTKVNGHLWVYASKFPPNWDVTPNLETVFADLSYAGIEGVELMENTLRYDDSVTRLNQLSNKYNLPIAGSSYGVGFGMWDEHQHKRILEDIKVVLPRLRQVKGTRLGISVGAAKQKKTEKELDAQARILKQILIICNDNGIEANLHNHTYEVVDEMHDLKGTLARIPEIKLGPDLNWLIRGGVNPVDFINTFGNKIVYLHIRDQYADGRWTEYVGQGSTDFGAISTALKQQQFSGDVAIELAFEKDFVPANILKEDWKTSRAFIRKTFGW